ncbi:tetratricopeptide repeat protein [Salinibius halmophilus]|uniref:tetratricopeptide repeat protein n=1 Tax=Salinibius halmophilus TaxID=1853216 RepID=UPI000E66D503|nr:tetratricopeptide repeat protein [Salinibius halmophilus]
MDCWQHLEIEPTHDSKQIKRAYARKLKRCNPEDNPEQFVALRQAYEAALAGMQKAPVKTTANESAAKTETASTKAESTETASTTKEDHTEASTTEASNQAPEESEADVLAKRFLSQLDALYQDTSKRTSQADWQNLFYSPALQHMGALQSLALNVFNYLGQHPHVPAQVWQFFEQRFAWQQNYVALSKYFSDEFIDRTLRRIQMSEWQLPLHATIADPAQFDHYLNGREYLEHCIQSEQWAEGEKVLADLLKLTNTDPELHRLAGVLFECQDNIATAKVHYQQIEDADAWLALARLASNNHERNECYRKVLEIDEQNIDALRGMANAYIEKGLFSEALAILETVASHAPYDVELRVLQLKCHQAMINNLKAAYQKTKGSKRDVVAKELVKSLVATEQYEEALRYIKSASIFSLQFWRGLRKHEKPGHEFYQGGPLRLFYRTLCEYRLGTQKKPEFELKYLLKKWHHKVPVHLPTRLLAEMYTSEGEQEKALERWQAVCKHQPSDDEAFYQVATLSIQTGAFDSGLAAAKQAVALAPSKADYHTTLGVLHSRLNQHLEALPHFQFAASKNLYSAQPYRNLAYCYESLNELDKAQDAADQAARVQERMPACWQQVLELAIKRQDSERANQAWEQLNTLAPETAAAFKPQVDALGEAA